MFYSIPVTFWDKLLCSIADATFWLLIIAGITFSLWFLFRSVVKYLIEDKVDDTIGEE
jgi:hypothetical protein